MALALLDLNGVRKYSVSSNLDLECLETGKIQQI